jgi:iron complex outermembrane receptor protein
MKKILFLIFLLPVLAFSQDKVQIKGTIFDASTKDVLAGAKIIYETNKGAISDFDGNFTINAESGKSYELKISFLSYSTQTITVTAKSKMDPIKIYLESEVKEQDEVIAKGEIAKIRETPVAFSNLSAKQIGEELGTRDLPMILNSTPGAYATESGGGSGDARVSIRGFDQRNVAVLVDGVPVNDMENGQVYWSNWDGLGDITRTMQVQRGLGASKLAIVSVGGTMNIITKGIDGKMSAQVKQEINSFGLYKTSFGYNSGMLKGKWGFTVAGSRKWGSSYADATFTDAWSYFFKVQKKIGTHTLTFGINGAPQSHGQRSTRLPIAVVDKALAEKTGIDYLRSLDSISNNQFTTTTIGSRGIRYNPNHGMVNGEVYNERVNFFHKPQLNLSHYWTSKDSKFSLSNVLYASIGRGGGTGFKSTITKRDTTTGLLDIQSFYNSNQTNISSLYSTTENVSGNYLRASMNNHEWVGLLSTLNYNINKNLTAMFGIDARYYHGSHFMKVYDLFGGDYAIDNSDQNQPAGMGNTQFGMKREGDKITYNNDATVLWGGAFGQVEYKKDKWSTFLTGSLSETAYQRIDFFRNKDIVLADTTFVQAVGYGDTLDYNGNKYTINSAEARYATTDRKWFLGSTIKGGVNYNIDEKNNIYMNTGFLNIAPRMTQVFDNTNKEFFEIKNQKVLSVELGYGFKSKKFASNINSYYTLWKNKPPSFTPTTPDGESYNINGLDALHMGVELDFIYKITEKLDIEGIVSLGDWKTISNTSGLVIDQDGQVVDSFSFSAKNVHVGDAAQIQLGGSLRYEFKKDLWAKLRYTYFTKNYANFDPTTLTGENSNRESWKMPSYAILDFNFGYDFKYKKTRFGISAGVMNILNTIYITDAQNGYDFDAQTSTVFVGMGRRFSLGFKVGI